MAALVDINQWLDALGSLYEDYGYLIVLLGAFSENTALLGLLLPGGTLALMGAFYAQQGELSLGWVILFAWIGTVAGYNADYFIGRLLLARIAEGLRASWLGRRLRLQARLRLGSRFLSRHGGKAILLSHLIGHIRSFVALSAGATHMPYRRFLAFELVAALLWNTAFCLLGYLAGTERERAVALLERSGWVALLVAVALFVAWRVVRARSAGRSRKSRKRMVVAAR